MTELEMRLCYFIDGPHEGARIHIQWRDEGAPVRISVPRQGTVAVVEYNDGQFVRHDDPVSCQYRLELQSGGCFLAYFLGEIGGA